LLHDRRRSDSAAADRQTQDRRALPLIDDAIGLRQPEAINAAAPSDHVVFLLKSAAARSPLTPSRNGS
jgi:hypothetical protein